ncbi:PREDICTED: RING-H2 finger protein ATL22-like [Ipomoea nil]|uniref:RING-H2 finger protein ATL22-like n=1 Tax=Ipomoea nil TaxID=35883 RepID=UPI000901852F|nr:PREDICTED: RING-H2 finger protein ATL22-like [Ipomoea nil]
MDFIFTFFFFFISFFSISPSTTTASNLHNCPPLKCNNTSSQDLTIQYPFHIQNQQPQECGLPGFALNCNHNKTTTLHFPSYGDLVVKSISYDLQRVDLLDPKNCVHEVFLNLNLSQTPFTYYYTLKEYKYLKCLAQLPPPYLQVPCLSVSGFHFYIVETCMSVPISCQHVKTVAIPFSYSPYLNDNSFGLRLSWKMSGGGEEAAGHHGGMFIKIAAYQVLVVAMFILVAMVVLYYVRTSKSKKLSSEEEMKMENNGDDEVVKVEALLLLGEYEVVPSSPSKGRLNVSCQAI